MEIGYMAFGHVVLALLMYIHVVLAGDVAPITEVPTKDKSSIVFFFSPDAMINAVESCVEPFEQRVLSNTIPNYNSTIKTPIGNIEFSLENVVFGTFNIGEVHVGMDTGDNSITAYVSDTNIALEFNYSIEQKSFPYKSEYGYGVISTYDLLISTEFRVLAIQDTGGIQVVFDELTFDIGNFNVDMDGGLVASIVESLEDLFTEFISNYISRIFYEFVNEYIVDYINDWSEHGMYRCIGTDTCIDYRFTCDPIVTDKGVYAYVSGVMYSLENQDLLPSQEFTEVDTVAKTYDLDVQVKTPTFQSLMDSLQLYQYFDLWNSSTKKLEPTVLEYSDIIEYYPKWAEAYPEGTNGKLSITTSSAPKAEIMYTGLRITINSLISLIPVNVEDTTNITSNVELVTMGDLWWMEYHEDKKSNVQRGKEYLTIELSVVSYILESDIVSAEWLDNILNKYYISQVNNTFGNNPIVIYSYTVNDYTDCSVMYYGDYVVINANFVYN